MTNKKLDSTQINDLIVQFLFSKIKNNRQEKEKLAQLLGISVDVLYKRLQSKTFFTLEEVGILMNTYQLSFDSIAMSTPFYAKVFLKAQQSPVSSVEDYLINLKKTFHIMQPIDQWTITYATSEVPIFYYFKYPTLACFKLFVYAKKVWKLSSFEFADKFSTDLFSPKIRQTLLELWNSYAHIKSTEIWTPQIWHTTFNQILFFAKNNGFEKSEYLTILMNEIQVCMEDMQTYVYERDKGVHSASFKLHENHLFHTNNVILAQKGKEEKEMLFITHDNPNYLYSEEPELMEYTKIWLDKVKEGSPILKSNDQIETFFKHFFYKLEQTRMALDLQ